MATTLLTRREAAARLGLSEISVKRLTLSGQLPSVKISSRCVRIDPAALEEFVRLRSTHDPLATSGDVADQGAR